MDKEVPHFWVSCLCQRLPFPCLRAAAGGFPASEVLLEMMQQRFVGAKCLISLPTRRVGALCTQRRGCLRRCWSLGATPLLVYGLPEKKPWRLGQEQRHYCMSFAEEAWAGFSVSFEDYPPAERVRELGSTCCRARAGMQHLAVLLQPGG